MAQFDEIEIFAHVVECGSITRAADRLGLSKSRVSECVIALETRLGVRLLDRTTRRVAPTEAGAIFHSRCRRALDEAQAGVDEVLARRDAPIGHLRVGAPDGFADRYVAPALARFLAAHPDCTGEIVEDRNLVDLVEQRLDLSVRIMRDPEPATIARRLAPSQVIVCASPDLLARRGAPAHPLEIPAWPCVGFALVNWSSVWRFEAPEALNVPVRPVLIANATASLRAAALAGLGLTAIPRWAVAGELAAGALRPVLPDWRLMESAIYAVYPSNRLVTSKVRRFVDALAVLLREAGVASGSG